MRTTSNDPLADQVNRDLETWLSRLPLADEQVSAEIPLEGTLLLRSSSGVLLLVGDLCLEFARADLVKVINLDVTEATRHQSVRAAVVVRRGAPLLGVSPRSLWEHRLPRGRAPFALSARPTVIRTGPMPRFRALERRYLESLDRWAADLPWS